MPDTPAPPVPPTALIAEDEPLLAQALQAELAQAWPELRVLASVGDGASAVREALARAPDVLFFDIRMPGQGGLEAAAELADLWRGPQPFPALVFVTAYDQYAVQAFETQAVDYLLKPVQAARLARTVAKLQALLGQRQGLQTAVQPVRSAGNTPPAPTGVEPGGVAGLDDHTLRQLRALLAVSGQGSYAPVAPAAPPAPADRIKVLQASVGSSIRMVPIDEVLYFEAADKYLRVLTAGHEYLLRTPLRELLPLLDESVFWQVHRGTVVRAEAIEAVTRDEAGKLHLSLRGRTEKLPVSRLYAHLFKAM